MNNVYERGELKVMVNSKPSFRDLMWACEYEAIILVPVTKPAAMPAHVDSYFAGWLDCLGFSEVTEKQRARMFVCMVKEMEEVIDEVIVDHFLIGIKNNGPGFLQSLQGGRKEILRDLSNKIPNDIGDNYGSSPGF